MSTVLLWRELQRLPSPRMTTEWKSIRLYPIPSIIYLIHNNVQFATLTYVDTSTYQIMGNLKIVTTAILFRCCSLVLVFYLRHALICSVFIFGISLRFFFRSMSTLLDLLILIFTNQQIFWSFVLGCFWGGSFLICSGWQLFYWLLGRPQARCLLESTTYIFHSALLIH